MSGAEEEWVKAAMSDDMMVAELLLRLHSAATTPMLRLKRPNLPLELDWTARQRRSKPVSVKLGQSQRASPTTPLSWSGATYSGGSGGAGVYEESSRPLIQKLTRSKVNGDWEKTTSKRSRKKKTLAELKDDETLLLKERRVLKKEIAALRMNLEKRRDENEKLKRIKIEFQPVQDREITSVIEESFSNELQPKTTAGHVIPPIMLQIVAGNAVTQQLSTSNGCPEPNASAASNNMFVLPDLNVPFEDDPCLDATCGVS